MMIIKLVKSVVVWGVNMNEDQRYEYLLARAGEVYTMAEQAEDPFERNVLLRIAAAYEGIAKFTKERLDAGSVPEQVS